MQGEKVFRKCHFLSTTVFHFLLQLLGAGGRWGRGERNKPNKNNRKTTNFKKDFNSHKTNTQILPMANKQTEAKLVLIFSQLLR